jgi:hypothetical protein
MTWESAILKAFDIPDDPNRALTNEQAYRRVQDFKPLEPHHRIFQWGERPAFQNQMRSPISNLCDLGQLKMLKPGLHCITPQGRARLATSSPATRI